MSTRPRSSSPSGESAPPAPAADPAHAVFPWWQAALLAFGVFAIDHLTKLMAIGMLRGHKPVVIVPGLLQFDYAENPGGAFSILADNPAMLTALATAGLGLIVWMALTTPPAERVMRAGFALMIGGALANLLDRYVRGVVIDFIDAHWGAYHWPTFNIADSAICVGVGLVFVRSLLIKDPAASPGGAVAAPPANAAKE